ncbi:MAG: DUF3341 domain-containing protein [Ignavibacteriae bacterium]|nr:DUF3341 domain-containing protein [Ignavibacteriota bacterium]MCB9216190.1 DUF3341 domain-containing protein [Ignavibacteria bacterium]
MSHTVEIDRPEHYGMIAEFDSPEALMAAAEKTRDAGYKQIDAYSSFPIEGMVDALGQKRTRLPKLILTAGITGMLTGLFLQSWTAASTLGITIGPYMFYGYPMNIGGRPMLSLPNFIPVTFEMTVLFAALTAVFGTILLNKLPMPYHPLFNAERFSLASQDKFFLCVEARDPKYDREGTKAFLEGLHPDAVEEVEH